MSYPGIAHFGGLGELSAEQLRELPSTAACARLTAEALDMATRAWSALRAPKPYGLGGHASSGSGQLRFVGEAFDRLSREYPSTRDGLSLTERRILAATAALTSDADAADPGGRAVAHRVFSHAAQREHRPFLGDTWAFGTMDRLIRAPAPLLASEPVGRPVQAASVLRLTAAGTDVLAGRADHIQLNGIDRWVGGVRLSGHEVAWRFDEGTETIRATR